MALHPNRYNRTSEAYDFTLFEGKEPEDKYTVHRKSKELAVGTGTGKEEGRLQTQSKSHVYRIKKQRSRARTFRVVVSHLFQCLHNLSVAVGLRFCPAYPVPLQLLPKRRSVAAVVLLTLAWLQFYLAVFSSLPQKAQTNNHLTLL